MCQSSLQEREIGFISVLEHNQIFGGGERRVFIFTTLITSRERERQRDTSKLYHLLEYPLIKTLLNWLLWSLFRGPGPYRDMTYSWIIISQAMWRAQVEMFHGEAQPRTIINCQIHEVNKIFTFGLRLWAILADAGYNRDGLSLVSLPQDWGCYYCF